MSTKSNNTKTFIKDAGVKNQLFVFAGSDTSSTSSNSSQSSIDVWRQSDFSVRVGQNSLTPIVPNIRWVSSLVYTPWSALRENTGNFYIYNNQNGYVYLCISDNNDNRKDLFGNFVSKVRPSHTLGIQRYSDGYLWKALYKITPTMERFVTSKWIPTISFDLFEDDDLQNQLSQTRTFCDDSATTEVGKCGVYAKKALSTDGDDGTIEFEKGELFTTAYDIKCSDCYYFTKNNDSFTSVFYSDDEDVAETISIVDQYNKIGLLISQNKLSSASPYYYLYEVNTNDDLEEGSVVSVFIDLSSFSKKQLTALIENPELTITSNTGSGARARLKTIVQDNQYIINGIELLAVGSGYKDISITIDSSYVTGNLDTDLFASKIEVNLDTIDGLAFDPVTVLNSQHVMIDARIDTSSFTNAGIQLPNNINFFGLVQNPIGISGSDSIQTGSNLNKKLDYVFRTTVKAQVQAASSAQLPTTDEVYNISYDVPFENTTTSKTARDIKVGGVVSLSSTTQTTELKNLVYSETDYLLNESLTGNSKTSQITSIVEKPVFRQYTGLGLSTTKLSEDITISDLDSVIIRINMVKGM
jgi:hypothetical protein